jgi:thioester reductase-like protein
MFQAAQKQCCTIAHQNLRETAAFPERFVEPDLSVGVGYSESKWVAERMLELAALKTPLRPIVVRMTQVAGGINGYWKPDEWLPSIVESAMLVKCLPTLETVGVIRALPFLPIGS